MRRVLYGGGSILTGDRIADALLDYAAALARAGTADHLSVPGIGSDGQPAAVDLVIGPASQLIAEHEETPGDDLEDDAFIAELERRSRLVAAGRFDQIGRTPDAGAT